MGKLINEAMEFAAKAHMNQVRKDGIPFILHPMEDAVIVSGMTTDENVIAAALLHDTIEDAGVTYEEICEKFGKRVGDLVMTETEIKRTDIPKADTWIMRKKESFKDLIETNDEKVKMLWLGDKLSNVRSFYRNYRRNGKGFWDKFSQKDPIMHEWYYRTILENTRVLAEEPAWGEYRQLIDTLFSNPEYHKFSVDGCPIVGEGATSEVYKIDSQRAIKLYKDYYEEADVEKEYRLMKKVIELGVPTPMPFGVVNVGTRFGILYEYIDAPTASRIIRDYPDSEEETVKITTDLLKSIHNIEVKEGQLPDIKEYIYTCIDAISGLVDNSYIRKIRDMVENVPDTPSMLHCDYHVNNIFIRDGKPILIDMDTVSVGHPIFEFASMFMAYIGFSEEDESNTMKHLGIDRETAGRVFRRTVESYYGITDEDKINLLYDRCKVLGYMRMIKNRLNRGDNEGAKRYAAKLTEVAGRVESLYN